MCSAEELARIERASVGVLGFTAKDLTPRAVAVTPYVIEGTATVTATLALMAKAKMLRNRPAAALLADGVHLSGDTTVAMHSDSAWFDAHIRARELEKYPPAKQLLGIPFHRRLLWWYVGRVAITFPTPTCSTPGGSDRVTITSVVDGTLRITPLAENFATDGNTLDVGVEVSDGPACLLVHHETDGMAELLQTTLRGTVSGGKLAVASRHGSLEPQNPSTLHELKTLRDLGRAAKANRPTIDAWAKH